MQLNLFIFKWLQGIYKSFIDITVNT